jgi:hypothetical protein
MKWLGWPDARVTPPGSDGGVDVLGRRVVAQVKARVGLVGRPDIQQLYGVAVHKRCVPLFFALAGYTREATMWADQAGVALFNLT